jgi:hypothetical protein
MRTLEENEVQSTLATIQDEQEEAGGCNDTDIVLRHMLEHKIPLTQGNYLDLCYFGEKSVEELGGEEVADLPGSFFAWPVDKHSTN